MRTFPKPLPMKSVRSDHSCAPNSRDKMASDDEMTPDIVPNGQNGSLSCTEVVRVVLSMQFVRVFLSMLLAVAIPFGSYIACQKYPEFGNSKLVAVANCLLSVFGFFMCVRECRDFLNSADPNDQDDEWEQVEEEPKFMDRTLNKTFKPLLDRVLVEKCEDSDNLVGTVVAVGPGITDEHGDLNPPELKIGDCVLVPDHKASWVKLDEKYYLVVRATDVLGKFE